MEALTHVLTQERRASASPRSDTAVASVIPGTGHSRQEAGGIPFPPPQTLSMDDFAKVTSVVRNRDWPIRSALSPSALAAGGGGGGTSPSGVPMPSSPSGQQRKQQQQQQQPRWGATGQGESADERAPTVNDAESVGGGGVIDQRLFEPVLRAILNGELDHVLRRSLLCHPFLKTTKGGASSAGGGGGGALWGNNYRAGASSKGAAIGAASSPIGGGSRRKDSIGSKSKAKKRDRDRAREQEELGKESAAAAAVAAATAGTGGSSSAGEGAGRSSPLDVSREMNRLAERAAADGSLQSALILVKTLLCVVDPGTQASAWSGTPQPTSSQQGSRTGRGQAVVAAAAAGSLSENETYETGGITLSTSPLRALAGRGLSGWSDMMEILWREKYRERMMSLRGLPSLTICSGKADVRRRLEAGGEASGVVTAVHVRHL